MQTIANKGRHVAEWGGYQVSLQVTDTTTLVIVRQANEPYTVHLEKIARSPEDGIELAASWLEGKGCSAFVDGRAFPLAHFLFFVPAGGL